MEAVPVKAAVIVPAVKLPEASRATIVFAVFKLVAERAPELNVRVSEFKPEAAAYPVTVLSFDNTSAAV